MNLFKFQNHYLKQLDSSLIFLDLWGTVGSFIIILIWFSGYFGRVSTTEKSSFEFSSSSPVVFLNHQEIESLFFQPTSCVSFTQLAQNMTIIGKDMTNQKVWLKFYDQLLCIKIDSVLDPNVLSKCSMQNQNLKITLDHGEYFLVSANLKTPIQIAPFSQVSERIFHQLIYLGSNDFEIFFEEISRPNHVFSFKEKILSVKKGDIFVLEDQTWKLASQTPKVGPYFCLIDTDFGGCVIRAVDDKGRVKFEYLKSSQEKFSENWNQTLLLQPLSSKKVFCKYHNFQKTLEEGDWVLINDSLHLLKNEKQLLEYLDGHVKGYLISIEKIATEPNWSVTGMMVSPYKTRVMKFVVTKDKHQATNFAFEPAWLAPQKKRVVKRSFSDSKKINLKKLPRNIRGSL